MPDPSERDKVQAHFRQGYVAVLAAAALWGTSSVVVKSLLNEGLSPYVVAEIRLTLAAFLTLSYLLLFRRWAIKPAWSHRRNILLLGTTWALGQFAVFTTISVTTVSLAVFLFYLAPVLVVLWELLVDRRPPTRLKLFGLGLAVVGVYMLSGATQGFRAERLGIAWGALSATMFAANTLQARRRVARADHWGVLGLGLATAALIFNLFFPPWQVWAGGYSASQWFRFLYLAALGTFVPFGLYLLGLRQISASRAILTGSLEPVVAAALASSLLHEGLTPIQVMGAGSLIAAAILVSREAH